ncbi:MAG: hypothetical protein NC318_13560 [Blautia sp.]|nr:hypothetical protein [Blautia sp.]
MGELFEHFKNIDLPAARKIAAEEGRKEGLAAGRTEGEELHLIKMVCKKLIKGRPASQIAEELEEELSKIERICQAAEAFVPDYDAEKIFNAMNVSNAR